MFFKIVRDERGATMVEYGLMLTLIAMVSVALISALGPTFQQFFEDLATTISGL